MVVLAVVLQTTLFVNNQARLFGVAPNLVLLAVVASVRYLTPEQGIFLGFTGGLLIDVLGGSPLGLWALVLTVVAYLSVRLSDRTAERLVLQVASVFVLGLIGGGLFLGVATLFGEQPLKDPGVWRILVLSAVYTALLAFPVLPGMGWLMRVRRRTRSWAL